MVEMRRQLWKSEISEWGVFPRLYHLQGQMILVGGDAFVRLSHGTIVPMTEDWCDTKAEADWRVLPELAKRLDSLVRMIDQIRNPRTVDQVVEEARECRPA